MRRVVLAAFVMGVSLSAVGCATVPMASAADDARMKQWQPLPENSVIYLYRNEFFGAAIHMEVDLDGRRAGATVANSYMVWEVPAGHHVLVSHAENDAALQLDTLPGQRIFVWQQVRMGILMARSQLIPVPEATGVGAIGGCGLVLMPLPVHTPPPAPAQALAQPSS
jgi:hypothetical protein